jgi:hypothetical protein
MMIRLSRFSAVVAASIICMVSGCDVPNTISASRQIAAPMAQDCLVESALSSETVVEARVTTPSLIVVITTIPEQISVGEQQEIYIQQSAVGGGTFEFELSVNWFGADRDPEFRAYTRNVLDRLLEEMIRKCTP